MQGLLRGFAHTHTAALMEPSARPRTGGKKVLGGLHLSLKQHREPTSSKAQGQCVTHTRESNERAKFFPKEFLFELARVGPDLGPHCSEDLGAQIVPEEEGTGDPRVP